MTSDKQTSQRDTESDKKTVANKMRKRLYQALPEDHELIDSVHFACKAKSKKRFYAESIVKDDDAKNTGSIEYLEPLNDFFALAADRIDAIYSLYGCYEKEYQKMTLAMYSTWYHSTSASVKFLDWYMRAGKTTWETGCRSTYNPFSGTR